MSVLVTGARGALGSQVTRLLTERGTTVYGTQRPGSGTRGAPDMRWLDCDLSKADEVRAAVATSKPSSVVHAAGLGGTHDLARLIEANVIALSHLLSALADTELDRMVVVGSGAEYAAPDGETPIREDHPLAPTNPYGLSKLFQFELSRMAVRAGTPLVYARPFNMIGPGVSDATAVGDITRRLARTLESGGDTLEVGDLDRSRDYVDVRDAAAACVTLLERGEAGGVYNVCSGVSTLLKDVVDRLLAIGGNKVATRQVEHHPSISFQVGDGSRLRALGWAPAYDLDTSLRDGLESELRVIENSG